MLARSGDVAAGSGPFQQQRPPLFPGGAGPPAQGHPVFPIGQAAGPAAIANTSSKPAPQPQPLFPVGQCTASGAAFAQGHLPKALAGAQPELQPRTDLPAGEPAASSASLEPGLAGGPQLGAGTPLQAQPAGNVANPVHATPHPQHIMPSLIAGAGILCVMQKRNPPSACLLCVVRVSWPWQELGLSIQRCLGLRVDQCRLPRGSCIWSMTMFRDLAGPVQGMGQQMAACMLHPGSMMRLLWMSQTQQSYGKQLICPWCALKKLPGCMC